MAKGARTQQLLSLTEVLDECQQSAVYHRRHVNSLLSYYRSAQDTFEEEFELQLAYVLTAKVKGRPVELCLQFIQLFLVKLADAANPQKIKLLESLLGKLAGWCEASDKKARQRVVSTLSQVILSLPQDFQLSEEVCQNLKQALQDRLSDKVAAIRACAARALQRLIVVGEDGDVSKDPAVVLLKACLAADSSADVREGILWALPESADTLATILERTADTSADVRLAAFSVLASRFFPLEGYSIRQRVDVVQRGLSDESEAVTSCCRKLISETWLKRDCSGNVLALLGLLDVEQHEIVGTMLMKELMATGACDQQLESSNGLRQFVEGGLQLLRPEEALFWRAACLYLSSHAKDLGLAAASAVGATAAVAADNAEAKNNQLDSLLPETVSDYVRLTKAHAEAGLEHRFAACQLLSLAKVLDFTDATARQEAAALVESQLLWGYSYREESVTDAAEQEAEAVELSLGGSTLWAEAVAQFAFQVHEGSSGQVFGDALLKVGSACRDGVGSPGQWLHCLAVTSMLLRSLGDMRSWRSLALEPQEVLNCFILPGVKHPSALVRKAAMECLGAYCVLSKETAQSHALLIHSTLCGVEPRPIRAAALKAFVDITLSHFPSVAWPSVEQLIGERDVEGGHGTPLHPIDVLVNMLPLPGQDVSEEDLDLDAEAEDAKEQEGIMALTCEGLAKLLVWDPQREYAMKALGGLLTAYVCPALEEHHWTKQMLLAFFQSFSVLPACKALLMDLYLPLVRGLWPKGSRATLTATWARQRATAVSKLMLCMLRQEPLQSNSDDAEVEDLGEQGDDQESAKPAPAGDGQSPQGLERLAVVVAVEMLTCNLPGTSGKQYLAHLAKTLLSFNLAPTDETRPLLIFIPKIAELVLNSKAAQKDVATLSTRLAKLFQLEQPLEEYKEHSEELLHKVEQLLESAKQEQPQVDEDDEEADSWAAARKKTSGRTSTNKARPSQGGNRRTAEGAAQKRSSTGAQSAEVADVSVANTPASARAPRPRRQSKTEASLRFKDQLKQADTDEEQAEWNSDESGADTSEGSGSADEVYRQAPTRSGRRGASLRGSVGGLTVAAPECTGAPSLLEPGLDGDASNNEDESPAPLVKRRSKPKKKAVVDDSESDSDKTPAWKPRSSAGFIGVLARGQRRKKQVIDDDKESEDEGEDAGPSPAKADSAASGLSSAGVRRRGRRSSRDSSSVSMLSAVSRGKGVEVLDENMEDSPEITSMRAARRGRQRKVIVHDSDEDEDAGDESDGSFRSAGEDLADSPAAPVQGTKQRKVIGKAAGRSRVPLAENLSTK